MAEKRLNSRVILKHDIEANWLKSSFIPLAGEVVIYDVDTDYSYERLKLGDGVQNVNALPFVNDELRSELIDQINTVDDKVDAVSVLVGDTAVSEQINNAAVSNQSDWSVNDETSPAYVKNRTHWSKISQVELLSDYQAEASGRGFVLKNKISIVVGHTYIINWNGTSYTCVAGLLEGLVYIGNAGQFGVNDTGEPFLIAFYPDHLVSAVGYYAEILPLDGSTACIISIIEHIEDIYKIDNKYLSDEALAKYDWNVAEGGLGHILNRTHYTEEVLDEVIPETLVTFGDATRPGRDTGSVTGSATQIYPEYGEMFAIEWNGVKYYSIARSYTKQDGSFGKGIGNTGMFGGAGYAEYPFLIGFLTESEAVSAGYTYFVCVNDGSTTATFSVYKVGEAVHTLDEKYIPNTIARTPKLANVTISSTKWTGSSNPWSQVVTMNGITANSKIDLQPTAVQIVELQNEEITLMLQNDDGVVTAWAIGNKPTKDYTMQVLITEVVRV